MERDAPTRRRVLRVMGLGGLGLALTACGLLERRDDGPDPLVALADAARADAVAAEALARAEPELADRLAPLATARREHAAALDAEVARLDPGRTPAASPGPVPATLAALGGALEASAAAATDVALDLPAERVGLVGAVAACCSAYATLLGSA